MVNLNISFPFPYNIFLLLIALAILSGIPLWYKKSIKVLRHKRYVGKGEKVIFKLKSFSGDYKEQRILTYLRKINPYVFEELVLTALENKNYVIRRNNSYSGDGGIDGVVLLDNKTILIQAKRYQGHVKTLHIDNFADLIKRKGASGGYFIHTGKTAAKSYLNYKGTDIQIISGQKLIDLILFQPAYDNAIKQGIAFKKH